jgi:hypothetical protein
MDIPEAFFGTLGEVKRATAGWVDAEMRGYSPRTVCREMSSGELIFIDDGINRREVRAWRLSFIDQCRNAIVGKLEKSGVEWPKCCLEADARMLRHAWAPLGLRYPPAEWNVFYSSLALDRMHAASELLINWPDVGRLSCDYDGAKATVESRIVGGFSDILTAWSADWRAPASQILERTSSRIKFASREEVELRIASAVASLMARRRSAPICDIASLTSQLSDVDIYRVCDAQVAVQVVEICRQRQESDG